MSEALKEAQQQFEMWVKNSNFYDADLHRAWNRGQQTDEYSAGPASFAWAAWQAALSRSAGPTNEPGFDEATETRWQKAIYEVCKEAVGREHYSEIDGAGCDSGDALDFTITEIQQALEFVRENSRSAPDREAEASICGNSCVLKSNHEGPCKPLDDAALAESPLESAPAPKGGDELTRLKAKVLEYEEFLSEVIIEAGEGVTQFDDGSHLDGTILRGSPALREIVKHIMRDWNQASDNEQVLTKRLAKLPAPGGHDLAMYLALKLPDSLNLHTSNREPLRKVIYELLCKFYSGGNRTFDPIHEVRKLREKAAAPYGNIGGVK